MKNQHDTKDKITTFLLSILALGVIIFIVFGGYWLFVHKNEVITDTPKVEDIESFGSTPEEAVVKFIDLTGNMGDPNQVNALQLENRSALRDNGQRRLESYNKAKDGLLSGSPLFITAFEKYNSEYSQRLKYPTYYEIKPNSIKIINKSEEKKQSINGSERVVVDIFVDFITIKTEFAQSASDVSWDGTYNEVVYEQKFSNVKFEVVRIEDKNWRIYDYDKAFDIGPNFSVWNPSNPSQDIIQGKIVKKIKTKVVDENGEQ